jgi:hypothetical protein
MFPSLERGAFINAMQMVDRAIKVVPVLDSRLTYWIVKLM